MLPTPEGRAGALRARLPFRAKESSHQSVEYCASREIRIATAWSSPEPLLRPTGWSRARV
jgi:hypothetical protein